MRQRSRPVGRVAVVGVASTPDDYTDWVGILDASRATDWTVAGTTIPTDRTQHGSTLSSSSSAATINAAIAAAAEGTYVLLGAGTFSLSAGLTMKSGVTLRGSGADQTILNFTGNVSMSGLPVTMVANSGYIDLAAPANTGNWTAGLSKGSTQITLSNVANLSAGDLLWLHQADDGSRVANDVTVGITSPAFAYGGTGGGGSSGRHQVEMQRVVSVAGSVVTVSPGIIGCNWTTAKTAKAAWISGAPESGIGIEYMTVNHEDAGGTRGGFAFLGARDCWVKGVKSRWGPRCHVLLWGCLNVSIVDNHFFEGLTHADQSYGVEMFDCSACLIQNNISVRVTAPWMSAGSASGNVIAYNYSEQNTYGTTWMQPASYYHSACSQYSLHEGNISNGIIADQVHGPSHHITAFRNLFEGWETGKTQQTIPVHIYAPSRYFNVIGNVLGRSGYHNTYQSVASGGTNSYTSIFVLGWGGNGASDTVTDDAFVSTSLMRWGNYDVVNAAVRWESSEVPSAITGSYDNAAPSTETLPASFYLTAKPAWFGSVAWPPIGPGVTSGDIANKGGYAHSIPAKVYYDAATKSAEGEILNYSVVN
jgi:hypothetical protein